MWKSIGLTKEGRVKLNAYQKRSLFTQQNGLCPGEHCGSVYLLHTEEHKERIVGQGAHLYPLNPSASDILLLEGAKRLGTGVNHQDNFILLCPTCHDIYDTFKTRDKYDKLLSFKEKIVAKQKSLINYKNLHIEKELREIIEIVLLGQNSENVVDLSYEFKTIIEKMQSDYDDIEMQEVKDKFRYFYEVIGKEINNTYSKYGNSFELIATQIKLAYLSFSKTNGKEDIMDVMTDWLTKKTGKSRSSCHVIISYFVQSCEVFSDVISK